MNTKQKKKSLLDLIEELDKRVSSLEEESVYKSKKGKKNKKAVLETVILIAENQDS